MPIHDWTRVRAGIFHDFHLSWIAEIKRALNAGLLPPDYYALAEQLAGRGSPDVLALEHSTPTDDSPVGAGRATVLKTPPKVRWTGTTDAEKYALKQRTLVIRHSSGDRVVALMEIVSPGNRSGRSALQRLVEKAAGMIALGYHLLIADLFPPNQRAPQGIHGMIWEELAGDETYRHPQDKPLTLASYEAGPPHTAYVEAVAVGDVLPDMPLFLEPEEHIQVPLEATYQAAWASVPQRWRRELSPNS